MLLNVSAGHGWQFLSDEVVGKALVNSPGPHGAATEAQAVPSSESEKVVPTSHTLHCTFCVAEPGVVMPEPTAQVAQVVHS